MTIAPALPRFRPPPQPLGLLGAIWHVMKGGDEMELIPEIVYREFLFKSPVAIGPQLYIVSGPEEMRRVLVENPGNYHKSPLARRILEPGLGEGLLTSEDEVWRRQRRAVAPLFQPRAFGGYAAAMAEAGSRLGEAWRARAGEIVDVSAGCADATYDVIMATMFGGDLGLDRTRLRAAIERYLATIGRVDPMDLVNAPHWVPRLGVIKGRSALGYLRGELARAAAERRKAGASGADLLDRLLAARDPESGRAMDDGEVVDNLVTLIVAGHETTALTLAWTLYLLALHPEAEGRLRAEIGKAVGEGPARMEHVGALPYLRQVLNEAMRLYPAAPVLARQALGPDRLGETEIKPGNVLLMPIYAMHRHHRLWESPDAFDPDRFSPEREAQIPRGAFLPFSVGPRVCVGAAFAVTEASLILIEILRRVRLSPVAGHETRPQMRITLRPADGLPMRVAAA